MNADQLLGLAAGFMLGLLTAAAALIFAWAKTGDVDQ